MSGKPLEERFNELCKIVQSLPKNGIFEPTDENKLKFYSYFKQATIGPVNTPQPYFFNVIERAKWDAW
jgi:acyl-CoA-binding protein